MKLFHQALAIAQIFAFIVRSKNIENKGTERFRVQSKIIALSWCIIFWDYFVLNYTTKVTSSYHLCVEYFSQFSFDSEMYTYCFKTAADYIYISESNEDWEKYSTQRQ